MLTLFLNTASQNGQIALVTKESVLQLTEINPKTPEQELVDLLKQTIEQAGHQFSDLTNVACVTGPGGFTSLRIGASAINTLAVTLGIPSCGIHEAGLYEARATEPDVLWLHSTKKDLVFAQSFGKHAQAFTSPTCVEVNQIAEHIEPSTLIMGELVEEHQKRLQIQPNQWCKLQPIEAILPYLLQAQEYTSEPVEPWYGRGW